MDYIRYIRSCAIVRDCSFDTLQEQLPPHLFDLATETTMDGSSCKVVFSRAYSYAKEDCIPYSKQYANILGEDTLQASDDPERVSQVILHLCKNHSGKWISPMPRKGVLIFDLGDVIWDECAAQAHIRHLISEVTGVSMRVVDSQWKKCAETTIGNRLDSTLKSLFPNDAPRIRSILSNDLREMDYDTFRSYHPIRPDARNVLFELSSYYNLAFLANQNERAWQMIADYGIELIVPIINLSCFSRYKKPQTDFFRELDRLFPLNFYEKYMIGNRIDMDLCPAIEMGWHTILFRCPNSMFDEKMLQSDFRPDMCVSSMSELLDLLPRYCETDIAPEKAFSVSVDSP